jgi:pseudaminic acid synthase
MKNSFTIGSHHVGRGKPAYCIAEISANHNQNFEEAVTLIHAAKKAGADAIKLQTYTADTLTIPCDNKYFRVGDGTLWSGRNLYDLYKEAYTPWEWQPELKKIAEGLGMDLFSTPFDRTAVDFLESLEFPAYKIASFELVDLPLIEYIAGTKKPIILSTGMASEEEIREALEVIRSTGNDRVALLKCTSAYPALPEEMNLRTIPDLREKFRVPVGLSDHTLGAIAPLIAVSLGACIIEKHFTLSRMTPGPDNAFSMEPSEFSEMVTTIRITESALGAVHYGPTSHEKKSLAFRRSLFVVKDIKKGAVLTEENVRSIRPGYGLHPKYLSTILGKRINCNLKKGTPLSDRFIEQQ